MVSTRRYYSLARLGWGVLILAVFVLLYSGQVRSLVPPESLPRPIWLVGVGGIALAVAGWLLISRFEVRSWTQMGTAAGLTADASSTGLIPSSAMPDLTGVVQGRQVRVHTASRTVSVPSAEGRSKKTIRSTLVETELSGTPPGEGLVIGRIGSGSVSSERTEIRELWFPNDAIDDEYVAVAGRKTIGREILTSTVRSALSSVSTLELLIVGDATAAVKEALEEWEETEDDSPLHLEAFDEVFHNEPPSVAIQTQGILHDAAELEHQVEAVIAVADRVDELESAPSAASEAAPSGDP